MKSGAAGMGMRKHGKSGKTPKSPRYRHNMLRELAAAETPKRPKTNWHNSVTAALQKH